MQDRDQDITKFSYNSYRKLKTSLGEFDAVVECNELAIREFLENVKKDENYIERLSKKHRVRVNSVGIENFTSRIRGYYISSVMQQSEQFLSDFKEEWCTYFQERTWIKREDGETTLDNAIKNCELDISSEILAIYNYYRLVRNYMSHTDRDLTNLMLLRKKIEASFSKRSSLTSLNYLILPNEVGKINFDDFISITNIVKNIAFLVCQKSKPENQRISVILYEKIKSNKKTLMGLKKLKNNQNRYKEALKSFTITAYGRFSSTDIDEVTEELVCLLA